VNRSTRRVAQLESVGPGGHFAPGAVDESLDRDSGIVRFQRREVDLGRADVEMEGVGASHEGRSSRSDESSEQDKNSG
jgi:hypothetical protein